MELRTKQYFKPTPKSHLFINKLKRINQIDRQIRKKWANLQKQNQQIDQRKLKNLMQSEQLKRMQSQILQEPVSSQKLKILKIPFLKQSFKRQQANLRKKNMQQIYFRKRQKSTSLKLSPPKSTIKKRLIISQKRIKTQGWQSPQKQLKQTPLMLQKRSVNFTKRLDIINKKYNENLSNIQKKNQLKQFKYLDSQKDMINKLKGTKIYYQFVSSFSTNNNQLYQ